jgi:hypothetical protein
MGARFGYTLMTEQSGPRELVEYASAAGQARYLEPTTGLEPVTARSRFAVCPVWGETGQYRVIWT